MVQKNKRNLNNTVLSVRVTPEEAERYWEIIDKAEARHMWVSKSRVIRELLDLDKPLALTAGDIRYFKTGKKQGKGLTLTRSENVRVRIPTETIGGKKQLRQKKDAK